MTSDQNRLPGADHVCPRQVRQRHRSCRRHRLRLLGTEHRQESSRARQMRGRGGLRQESRRRSAAPARLYPGLHLTTDFQEVLTSPDIDAVAVITPVWTHFELAKAALRERQARLRREALYVDVATGRGAHRARRSEEPEDHGGPHLPVQRCGQEDSRDGRRRNAGSALLLRFDPGESGPLPARRQRRVGPRAARSVDHGLHHHGQGPRPSSRPAANTSTAMPTWPSSPCTSLGTSSPTSM